MSRDYYYLFVCCFLIGHTNLNTGEKLESSIDINRLLTLQEEIQKLQDQLSSSITALQSAGENNNLIINQPFSIEKNFRYLQSELGNITENLHQPAKGSLKSLESDPKHNNTDQSPSSIIADIRNNHFQSAEEKLKQIKNLQEVSNIIGAVYESNSNNFDLLANFIESLTDINLIYTSVGALQRELAENDHTNPFKCIRLAKVLETKFINFPVDYYAKELGQLTYNALREPIADLTLKALTAALADGEFDGEGEMDNLTVAVYLYDSEQWENIIYKFVNSNIEKVSNVLNIINSHRLMEQRVIGVNILYWSIQFHHNPRSDVIIKIASILKELSSYTLDAPLRDLVDKIIENLPACARNLFFLPSSSACIWSEGAEAYLTAINSTMKNDPKLRQVFSTINILPGSHWYFKNIDNYFVISSTSYENELLFASRKKHTPNLRHIFNRIPKNGRKIEEQAKWLIELDNDRCYLKSAKYYEYLISSNFYYGVDMRYLGTWVPKNFFEEPQFQWQIRDCN